MPANGRRDLIRRLKVNKRKQVTECTNTEMVGNTGVTSLGCLKTKSRLLKLDPQAMNTIRS